MSVQPNSELGDIFEKLFTQLDELMTNEQIATLKDCHAMLTKASQIHQQYLQISKAQGGAPGEPINISLLEDLVAHAEDIAEAHERLQDTKKMFERIRRVTDASEAVILSMEPALQRAWELTRDQ